MGQGQRQAALEAIRICAANGGWVCLKNLHLAISDLAAIEKAWKKFPILRIHSSWEDFNLLT